MISTFSHTVSVNRGKLSWIWLAHTTHSRSSEIRPTSVSPLFSFSLPSWTVRVLLNHSTHFQVMIWPCT